MKSALRATAILGGSSILTIVIGVFSSKGWATLLGAQGLGYLGLLQSLVGLAVLVAGLGIGPGLVRAGANAIALDDFGRVSALRWAAWVLIAFLATFATIGILAFRDSVSRVLLDSGEHGRDVSLLAIAVVFALAGGIQSSTLNAYHRVGALAKVALLSSALSTALGLSVVWKFGRDATVFAVIGMAAVTFAVSFVYQRREVGPVSTSVNFKDVILEARELVRFGGPFTASQAVGSGVQLLLPVLVMHSLTSKDVGYQRAAMAISITYIGFLLTAMAQDYFPRVSAASHLPQELNQLANEQQRLIMMLGTPLVIGLMALAPYLVPILYSSEFRPATGILEWQLLGDLFKLSSWTMAYVVLARSGSLPYFFIEFIGGTTLLASTWLGMQWFGLSGIGIGLLVSYALYWIVVWIIARRTVQLSWTRANWTLFIGALLAAVAIRSLSYLEIGGYRTAIGITIALAFGIISLRMVTIELGGVGALRTLAARSAKP